MSFFFNYLGRKFAADVEDSKTRENAFEKRLDDYAKQRDIQNRMAQGLYRPAMYRKAAKPSAACVYAFNLQNYGRGAGRRRAQEEPGFTPEI